MGLFLTTSTPIFTPHVRNELWSLRLTALSTQHYTHLPPLRAPPDDHWIRALVMPRAIAERGLAPRRLRLAADRRLALATAMWMVARVHHRAAHRRPLALVAGSAPPCRSRYFRGQYCRPAQASPCSRARSAASRRRACAPARTVSDFATTCAATPADRTNCPPRPGFSSIL